MTRRSHSDRSPQRIRITDLTQWEQAFEWLTVIEGRQEPADLARAIEEVLSDEQRAGRPTTLTAEQLTLIFAIRAKTNWRAGIVFSDKNVLFSKRMSIVATGCGQ